MKTKTLLKGSVFIVDKIHLFCYDSFIMAIPKKIINFLEKSGVRNDVITHRKVYTAIDKARTLKMKAHLVAKTVVLKVDRLPLIALIPADTMLDLEKLKKILGTEKKVRKINFASEKWIKENIKGMKEGAIPPFGSIWGLPVLVDKGLMKNTKIVVNSGSHTQSIRLTPSALRKLIPGLKEGIFSKKKPVKKKKGV